MSQPESEEITEKRRKQDRIGTVSIASREGLCEAITKTGIYPEHWNQLRMPGALSCPLMLAPLFLYPFKKTALLHTT
jgi:hypothetical protein